MSRSALNEESTIMPIGSSDQASTAAIASALAARRKRAATLGRIGREGLPVEPAQIEDREQQRGEDEQPARRRGSAERVVAERLEIEIDGQDLGRAGGAAAR